ncbi:hypothetical protein K502DRAFT_213917 [Neoconidiobolus thromboides FSU 785]|nr:hypothetical protein K502DRAFT_213917 [Neoconidiobolus thromboides FSU 785]
MLDFYANQIWRFLCMLYLIIIAIIVVFKLNQGATLIKTHKYFRNTKTSKKAENSVRILAYRILLYPLVMVFTQFPGIISQFYYDLNSQENEALDQWSLLVLPFAGTLNFLAFCCDPTVYSAVKKIYLRLKYKYFTSRRIEENTEFDYNEHSSDTCITITNPEASQSIATADTMVSNFMRRL